MKRYLHVFLFVSILIVSCKKESFITTSDASLTISSDSLKFDTVFTTTGSVTQSFKIINTNSQKLLLSEIRLMGGAQSAYKMNVNGMPSVLATDLELAAYDSLYVFVAVNINPGSSNLPFIVSDSIRISYNGNERWVQLEAYGQNAHFLRNEVITGTQTWNNDLPYVILGSLQVDTGAVLHINAGCSIYAHADAPLLVDGTLLVTGEKNNEVVFTGDRLDPDYSELPAGWPGIVFRNTSSENMMRFAVVKNAFQALVLRGPSVNSNPKLILHQCIIDNAYDAGVLSYQSSVDADNTLISNCGSNLLLTGGGTYHFTNCTSVCYSNLFALHDKPVLQLTNYNYDMGGLQTNDLDAGFTNCIFWGDFGNVEDEVTTSKEGNTRFDVTFSNCLFKATTNPANSSFNSCLINQDPLFDSVDVSNGIYDFRTMTNNNSPAPDNGITTTFPKDLDDNPRLSGSATDIGCFEKP